MYVCFCMRAFMLMCVSGCLRDHVCVCVCACVCVHVRGKSGTLWQKRNSAVLLAVCFQGDRSVPVDWSRDAGSKVQREVTVIDLSHPSMTRGTGRERDRAMDEKMDEEQFEK